MSIKLLSDFLDNPERWPYSSGTFAVLVVLTDFSNDKGFCWPSVEEIARKSRLSERQVKRVLGELVEDGVIERTRRLGTSNTYQFLPPYVGEANPATPISDNLSPPPISDNLSPLWGHPRPHNGDTHVPTMGTPMSPDPSKNRQDDPSSVYAQKNGTPALHSGTRHEVTPPGYEGRGELITALSKVCKPIFAVGINESDYRDTADALIDAGYGPEDVETFAVYWRENGYYAGRPALKTLLSDLPNAVQGQQEVGGQYDDAWVD